MLSRARNALIMIGNSDTFISSRKGKDVWVPLMDQLTKNGHVYDGFPVKCEQHPDKVSLLTDATQFDIVCPDGGCSEPWYVPAVLNLRILRVVVAKCSSATFTSVLIDVIKS